MCLTWLAPHGLHQVVNWRGKISLETINGKPQPHTAFSFSWDLPLQDENSPAQSSSAGEATSIAHVSTQQGDGRAGLQLNTTKVHQVDRKTQNEYFNTAFPHYVFIQKRAPSTWHDSLFTAEPRSCKSQPSDLHTTSFLLPKLSRLISSTTERVSIICHFAGHSASLLLQHS